MRGKSMAKGQKAGACTTILHNLHANLQIINNSKHRRWPSNPATLASLLASYLFHIPFLSRNVGIPLSALMPAPVKTTMFCLTIIGCSFVRDCKNTNKNRITKMIVCQTTFYVHNSSRIMILPPSFPNISSPITFIEAGTDKTK